MSRITITFRPVRVTRQYHGKCPVCFRPVRRSRTFEQTVNSFNTNADGMAKTEREVYADVQREASAYVPDFTHTDCRALREGARR